MPKTLELTFSDATHKVLRLRDYLVQQHSQALQPLIDYLDAFVDRLPAVLDGKVDLRWFLDSERQNVDLLTRLAEQQACATPQDFKAANAAVGLFKACMTRRGVGTQSRAIYFITHGKGILHYLETNVTSR